MDIETKERVDGVDTYYKPIKRLEGWTSRLFWFSAVFSVAVLYSDLIPWRSVQDVPTVAFVAGVILHLGLSLYLRLYLIPLAERKRRKQLLSDSFGVPLTPEQTRAYYNNRLAPSIERLGANVLENAFFSKSICGRMAVNERIRAVCYFIFWFLVVFWRSTPLGLLVIITETVFSGQIIEKLVSLELLRHRNEDLFDELYHEFLHKIDFNSQTGTACVLDAFSAYEATKAAAALKLSTKIFKQYNSELSSEWDEIRRQLAIDTENSNQPME